MPLVRLTKNPTGRQLLVFALAWLACFGALSASAYRHHHRAAAVVLAAAAVVVPLAGAVVRPVLRWAFLGLSYVTYPIGLMMSYIVLALVYFVALTPIGWIMRLAGHDALGRRFDAGRASYWTPHRPPPTIDSYFKQD